MLRHPPTAWVGDLGVAQRSVARKPRLSVLALHYRNKLKFVHGAHRFVPKTPEPNELLAV